MPCRRFFVLAHASSAARVDRGKGPSGKPDKSFGIESEWCCQTGLNCRPLHYQFDGPQFLEITRDFRTVSSLFTFGGKAHAVPIEFNPCRGIEHFPEEGRERAAFEERAAILEFDEGLSRPNAEHLARQEIKQQRRRRSH